MYEARESGGTVCAGKYCSKPSLAPMDLWKGKELKDGTSTRTRGDGIMVNW